MKALRYGTQAFGRFVAGLPRASTRRPAVERSVAAVLRDVRRSGDRAVIRWTQAFDSIRLVPSRLRVSAEEIRARALHADPKVVTALREMAARIEAFHRRQLESGFRLQLVDGSLLEELVRPLDSVGLYVPGGAGAYPSSVLMSAIPARVARVPRVVVVTPPRTLEANPALAAALEIAGVEADVFRIGGAQAIAALAYGTETVPAVAKIVGPGNAFVAAAKRQLQGVVATDGDAGPSEVVILADDTADARLVAADLLAQAEHGSGDESVVLVTTDGALAADVRRRVAEAAGSVANPRATRRALRSHGATVLVRDLDEGIAAVNTLAPEHAEVMTRSAMAVARRILAGAVFAGRHAPVAVGDYGIGPNHILPTGGSARRSSPLSVRDFQRRQSLVRMTRAGLARVASGMLAVAWAEGFVGHAHSIRARFSA